MFLLQLLTNILYALNLLLLGATTGFATSFIVIAKCFLLSQSEHTWAAWRGWVLILISVSAITTITTWNDPFSIIPLLAASSTILAGWTHNGTIIRKIHLFINCPLWILYDLHVQSYSAAAIELLCIGSILVAVKRRGWNGFEQ